MFPLDCEASVKGRPKLREHLRSHTQEKVVACPGCGGMYANNTKLFDHIIRQKDMNGEGFSRRRLAVQLQLLHLRFVCCRSNVPVFPLFQTICDRAAPKRPHENSRSVHCGSLCVHTGFIQRLYSFSPLLLLFATVSHYKCPLCDMTCPTPSARRNHIKFRHSNEKPYSCDYCEYRLLFFSPSVGSVMKKKSTPL